MDLLIAALQKAKGLTARGASSLEGLRFVASKDVGDVWALHQLWLSLGFEDLSRAWRSSKSEVEVLACLRSMVFNRLCDPSSKLGVLRWLETVALPVGFGFADGLPEHHHLLRADLPPACRTKVMEQSPLISENSGYETIQIYR